MGGIGLTLVAVANVHIDDADSGDRVAGVDAVAGTAVADLHAFVAY